MPSLADRLRAWAPLACGLTLAATGVALQGWWVATFTAGTAALLFAVHWFWPADEDEPSEAPPPTPGWPEEERLAAELLKLAARTIAVTAAAVGLALLATRWIDHAAFPALAGGLIASTGVRLIRLRSAHRPTGSSVAGL